MPATRALGSMSRNAPIVVPVLLWPHAGTAASNAASAAPRSRFLMRSSRSLDDRELADVLAEAGSLDVVDVQAGRHVQVVLGTQIPGHEAVVRTVLAQRGHQLAAHSVDADHGVQGDRPELDAPLAAAGGRET